MIVLPQRGGVDADPSPSTAPAPPPDVERLNADPLGAITLSGVTAQACLLEVARIGARSQEAGTAARAIAAALVAGLAATGCRIDARIDGSPVSVTAGDPDPPVSAGDPVVIVTSPLSASEGITGELRLAGVDPMLREVVEAAADVIGDVLAGVRHTERERMMTALVDILRFAATLEGSLTEADAERLHGLLLALPGVARAASAVAGKVALGERAHDAIISRVGTGHDSIELAVVLDAVGERLRTGDHLRDVLQALATNRLREQRLLELERLVDLDALTGIASRDAGLRALEIALARADRNGSPVSILYCDIDRLAHHNDIDGTALGDESLRQLGRLLRHETRLYDGVARMQDDEFLVILPDAGPTEAIAAAQRLNRRVPSILPMIGGRRPTTISIGIASHPVHGTDVDDLVEVAMRSLERAKQAGRDRIWIE